jgi:hypothetical protein
MKIKLLHPMQQTLAQLHSSALIRQTANLAPTEATHATAGITPRRASAKTKTPTATAMDMAVQDRTKTAGATITV